MLGQCYIIKHIASQRILELLEAEYFQTKIQDEQENKYNIMVIVG